MIELIANRKKEPSESEEYKVEDANKKFKKELLFYIVTAAFCIVVIAFCTIYISGRSAKVESVPETGVTETIKSTSAPVETSIPIVEETIHIEETVYIEETQIPDETESPTETSSEAPSQPPSASAPDIDISNVDPEELEMLACVIYQESGGDRSCDLCRYYVADIVLNRVNHPDFPDTMYEVLTAKDQYGRFYYTGIKWPERAKYAVEKHAVERAYNVAKDVLSGNHSELYGQGYIWQAQFTQGTSGFWCCDHYYGKG
jgi:hypothetical protein